MHPHFFQLHYPYTSVNGPVRLSGWSVAVEMQQAPRVSLSVTVIFQAGLLRQNRFKLKSEHTNASTLDTLLEIDFINPTLGQQLKRKIHTHQNNTNTH